MPTFQLARQTLDPGLFSDHAQVMHDFYTRVVGLPFQERLEHNATYAELFYTLPEGKLKIQAFEEPLEPAVSGYRTLLLAREGQAPAVQCDPDGLTVEIVAPGARGVTNVGVVCVVPDVEKQARFLVEGMGARAHEGGYRVGDTQLFLEEDRTLGPPTPPMRRGFTYLTLIVHDADACRRDLIAAGASPSLRLLRLADRCVFSWLRDPHGNWIEIVQYAHLSGALPDIDRIADHWDEVERWRAGGDAA